MLRVNHLSGFGKKRPASGSSYDTDAQAFFTAAGISDTTQKDAVDALVVSLKADGIWTKCYAIYPFVGGSSSTHAVNLKNPGTYDITWNGTITHDSNGVTGGGGYGTTGLNGNSVIASVNSVHLSIYSRTSASASHIEIGTRTGASDTMQMGCRFSNLAYTQIGVNANEIAISNGDGQGFYVSTRRSSTDAELYKNGSSIGTDVDSNAGASKPNQNFYVCSRNDNGTPSLSSTKNIAFASIGDGLTGTEVSNFNTAVETFQDALSRGVV